ncbi:MULTISPECIES: arylesterase [Desertivirga]|uniref:arylesterase n=1 Tax=Desertivirga TaxID=3153690 RepID=UPI001A961E20|nr:MULTISPECIES: arylesterase [unclassified Pedobacter]
MQRLPIILLALLLIVASCSGNKPEKEKQSEKKEKMTEIKNLVFFGNSLTAGYGLEDPSDAFPAVIQRKIDSLKLPYKVINAGLSGETTAGGKSRIDWLLKQKVDVFVLELGANDGLRGIPVTETKKNLQAILDKVKAKYPEAQLILLGMEIPPNMGGTYVQQFRSIFRQVAEANKIPFVPFLLEGVAGNVKLNLKDGIHPTAEGYKIVAENVWEVLKEEL